MSTDAKTVYQSSLTATHAAEQQALQTMETQLKGMDDFPAYAALLEKQCAVTREQLQRISQALEETGSSPNTIKEAVTSTVGTVGEMVHRVFPDTQLKNLFAGYGYQYYQIAAYTSLAVLADLAGFSHHRQWIEQSLREEEEGAREAQALIAPITRVYFERETAAG